MAMKSSRAMESHVKGSPTTYRPGLDSDSGLGSDTDSFSNTDKGELIFRATQLNDFKNIHVATDPLHAFNGSKTLRSGDFTIRGFDEQITNQMLQTYPHGVDPGYVLTDIHKGRRQFEIKVKTPESISSNRMDVGDKNKMADGDRAEIPSSCDELINSIQLSFIELDEANKISNSRCATISHSSQNISQFKNHENKQNKPPLKSKPKLFSSQTSLVSLSKSSDVSDRSGLETENSRYNLNTFGHHVPKNNNQSRSRYRSEENLTKHQQVVAPVIIDKQNNFSDFVANKPLSLDIPHASIKNRNALNLRLFLSALSDMNAKVSLSTPTTPLSSPLFRSNTPSSDNQYAVKRNKYTKAKSLDSTPQQSPFHFNICSLPVPEKSKKSAFSSLRKFFSLTFKSRSSLSEGDQSMKCRRELFSDVIKEETAFEMKEGSMKKRFAKNISNGKVWLINSPESTPTIRSVRSQPTTPTRDLRTIVTPSDQDSVQDDMRIILALFMKSSKNRIIKQLQQLDCTNVNDNGRTVLHEECFQNLKKEFLNICQRLFVSFRELSLSLFNSRAGMIRAQTDYYKNSESYVQHLDEFLVSSRNFIDGAYASRVKYKFKALAKDVGKEGFNFLETSHDCMVANEDGKDVAYMKVDELFNRFSNKFAKLIKWSRELQYHDTVSILW